MTDQEFIKNGTVLAPFNGVLMEYDENLRAYLAWTGRDNYVRQFNAAWKDFYKNSELEKEKDYGDGEFILFLQDIYKEGFNASWSLLTDEFVSYMQVSPVERDKMQNIGLTMKQKMDSARQKFLDNNPHISNYSGDNASCDIWNSGYAEAIRRFAPVFDGMNHLLANLGRFYPQFFS